MEGSVFSSHDFIACSTLVQYHDIKLLTWCRSKLVGKFGRQIRFYLTLDHEEMDIETSSTAI